MDERTYLIEIARSLHWGYTKYWTGTAGSWREVPPDERKLWVRLARRVSIKIDDLKAAADAEMPDD